MIKTLKNKIFLKESEKDVLLEEFKINYLETNAFVRNSIYWMVRSERVDDIVQETYLKAWKSYSSYKKNSSFKTWIYRIAMNTTYDYLKTSQVQSEFNEENVEVLDKNIDERELISICLLKLKVKHREAFIMYYKFGYTTAEIADLIGKSEGTVKSRLHYAKIDFEKYYKKYGVLNG